MELSTLEPNLTIRHPTPSLITTIIADWSHHLMDGQDAESRSGSWWITESPRGRRVHSLQERTPTPTRSFHFRWILLTTACFSFLRLGNKFKLLNNVQRRLLHIHVQMSFHFVHFQSTGNDVSTKSRLLATDNSGSSEQGGAAKGTEAVSSLLPFPTFFDLPSRWAPLFASFLTHTVEKCPLHFTNGKLHRTSAAGVSEAAYLVVIFLCFLCCYCYCLSHC